MQTRQIPWWILGAALLAFALQQVKEGQPVGVALLNLGIMGTFAGLATRPDRLTRWSLLFLTAVIVPVVNGLAFSPAGFSVLAVVAQAAFLTVLLGGASELLLRYLGKVST